jgi:hypothetical protein
MSEKVLCYFLKTTASLRCTASGNLKPQFHVMLIISETILRDLTYCPPDHFYLDSDQTTRIGRQIKNQVLTKTLHHICFFK